jgi:hypothetical protein
MPWQARREGRWSEMFKFLALEQKNNPKIDIDRKLT